MPFRIRFFAALSVVLCVYADASAYGETNDVVIISAPRLDYLDLMSVNPAADVTVIDREMIRQAGVSSVPELLQTEANLLVRGEGGSGSRGQLSMRGFGDNSHVRMLVLVDGHKINPPDMAQMDWQNVPVSSIERIEVVRGGQNVLYGNHALAGVIKITTKRGGRTAVDLSETIGSFGYLNGSVFFGSSAGDVDWSLSINGTEYSGYRENSSSDSLSFSSSAGWFMNDTDVLTLRISGSDSFQQFPGPLSYEDMMSDSGQSDNSGDQFAETLSGLAALLYESEREWGAGRINFGLNTRSIESSISGQYARHCLTGLSVAPRIRLGSEDDFLLTGVDLFYDMVDVDNYYNEERTIVESWAELSRMTAASYLFMQRTLADQTILSGGARIEYAGTDNVYTHYRQEHLLPFLGPFPNPDYQNPADVDEERSFDDLVEKYGWAAELSVNHALSETIDVFGGYDRVYRYPTLDEAASYQGYPLSDPLNSDLDPEQGNNFEIGGRYDNDRWIASVTFFYLMLENEIIFDSDAELNVNIGATRRLGAELFASWDKKMCGLSSRWTVLNARFSDGEYKNKRVPLVPGIHGNIRGWVKLTDRLRCSVDWSYISGQYQGNDFGNESFRRMDAYDLVQMQAAYSVTDKASFNISVQNLFDENYAPSAFSGGFYPGAGRSFRVGMKVHF